MYIQHNIHLHIYSVSFLLPLISANAVSHGLTSHSLLLPALTHVAPSPSEQSVVWLGKQPIKPNFWVNSGLQCLSCRIPFTLFHINTWLLLLHAKVSSKNSESCNDYPCHLKIHGRALCDREEKYASRHHSATWFKIYGKMLNAAYTLSFTPPPPKCSWKPDYHCYEINK